MVAQLQRRGMQFGSRMLATFLALGAFRTETPKPTNAPNLQRFIEQL